MNEDFCAPHYKGFWKTTKRVAGECKSAVAGVAGCLFYPIAEYFIRRSKAYDSLIRENILLKDKTESLERENVNVYKENAEISDSNKFLRKTLETYRVEAVKTPEYLRLYSEKTAVENERNALKEECAKRGNLIDLLKKDKRQLITFSRQVMDKSADTALKFLVNSGYSSKDPLVFINKAGFVVGYTKALKEKLNLHYELLGENCFKILARRYSDLDGNRKIRSFFNTYSEKSFDIELKDGEESVKLSIVKGEPVLLRGLDLGVFGRDKTIDAIAFIPILVNPINTIGALKRKVFPNTTLDAMLEKHEREVAETHAGLIRRHGWNSDMILEAENRMGYEKLRQGYLVMEEQLMQRVREEKKKR